MHISLEKPCVGPFASSNEGLLDNCTVICHNEAYGIPSHGMVAQVILCKQSASQDAMLRKVSGAFLL